MITEFTDAIFNLYYKGVDLDGWREIDEFFYTVNWAADLIKIY